MTDSSSHSASSITVSNSVNHMIQLLSVVLSHTDQVLLQHEQEFKLKASSNTQLVEASALVRSIAFMTTDEAALY